VLARFPPPTLSRGGQKGLSLVSLFFRRYDEILTFSEVTINVNRIVLKIQSLFWGVFLGVALSLLFKKVLRYYILLCPRL